MNVFTVATGLRGLYTHRNLLRALALRDVQTRYRGTWLGGLWVVIQPLAMLALYTFVFGGVFKSRWGVGGDIKDFILMLYCGLIVHGSFSETLTRSPSVVILNPNYVKKVVFPLELLPCVPLLSAIFNVAIGLVLLTCFIFFEKHTLPWTAALVPIALLPFLILTAGLSWLLAAIGVFFRDIGQLLGMLMSILMFLSPIFYPISSVPEVARDVIQMNPLTYPIETLRSVLIQGIIPNFLPWVIYFVLALLVAFAGLWAFQKSRVAFADVI